MPLTMHVNSVSVDQNKSIKNNKNNKNGNRYNKSSDSSIANKSVRMNIVDNSQLEQEVVMVEDSQNNDELYIHPTEGHQPTNN